MKTGIPPVLITIALVCFALVQNTLAVSPAPDGGYPGANTAEGTDALLNLSSGIANTAVGNNALRQNTTGSWNVALGSGTLASNTTGNFNMAIGTDALTKNTANFNLANGFRVGFMNTTGNHLTGIGAGALQNNTTAGFNTAIGSGALLNTTGNDNIALGDAAGLFLATGDNNIDIGNNGVTSDSGTTRIGTMQGAIYLAGIAGQIVGGVEPPVTSIMTASWGCFSPRAGSRRTSPTWALPVRRSWRCVQSPSVTSPSWIKRAPPNSALWPRKWPR